MAENNDGQVTGSYSTTRLVTLALVLSFVMAIELAAGNGFLKAMLSGNVPLISFFMVALMIASSTGAIIGAFTTTLKPHPTRVAAATATCAIAMVCGVEASQSVSRLPVGFYYAVSLAGQVLFTFCVTFVACSRFRIQSKASRSVPAAAAIVMTAFGLICYAAQSWISLENAVQQFSFVRDLTVVLAPLGYLAYFTVSKSVRLDKESLKKSLEMRLPEFEHTNDHKAWKLFSFGLAGSLVLNTVAHVLGLGYQGHPDASAFWGPLQVFNLGLLGVVYMHFSELRNFTSEQKHGDVSVKISPKSAQRFLRRHHSDKNAWAATAGLKTSNYLIDHDPGAILHRNLPASIMQLRSDEIQRCVSEVLGPLNLHNHVVGHRILGVIDPENSVRSCIDTLKMFAALYLDATPLVERRIKGLTSLLPIIDPGLATVMKSKDIDNLIRRNLWFFHFNFSWIDQHVIHTPRSTRYDVRMTTLSSRIRHTMFEHLEKTGGVGNFVWIGTEARDRILHEAPALKNVIEPCPIPSAKDNDELLMFTLKFEQLIPRLQRYFDLDSMRRTIMDFDPSQESLKLLNLLNIQFAKTKSADEVLDILKSLTSVPWRGFKEKDQALQLILKAHAALNQHLNSGKNICDSQDERFKPMHQELLRAVQTIGYPSQILHNAQIAKITLRDLETLMKVASAPDHARFHEAWLLLSTNDYHRLAPEDLVRVVDFLADVATSRKVTRHRIVQIKTIDALVNLARNLRDEQFTKIEQAFSKIGVWFAQESVDSDICCLFLDAHEYVSDLFGRSVVMPQQALDSLDHYFSTMQSSLGASHPRMIAILSRWQIFRSNREGQNNSQGAA